MLQLLMNSEEAVTIAHNQLIVKSREDSISDLRNQRAKRNLKSKFDLLRAEVKPNTLCEAIDRLNSRTSAEVDASRKRVLDRSAAPRPLPLGKTLDDAIVGQWTGDETDDQIYEALRNLS